MAKKLKDYSIQENARACRLIGKATVWQALAASPHIIKLSEALSRPLKSNQSRAKSPP